MYDKRYSDKEIERIRKRASISMFIVMLFLVAGVGKVAYKLGYQDGYYSRVVPAMQQTSR